MYLPADSSPNKAVYARIALGYRSQILVTWYHLAAVIQGDERCLGPASLPDFWDKVLCRYRYGLE